MRTLDFEKTSVGFEETSLDVPTRTLDFEETSVGFE
jgi:hypothetical protein